MRINIVKSKNAEQLYIIKSYRKESGSTTSRIVKKLGSVESLLPKFDEDRDKVIAWAKEQARLLTEQEKAETLSISVDFSESRQNEKGEKHLFNAGYLFPKTIYSKLGLPAICKQISSETNIDYNLSDVLAKLIYTRIIAPSSKLSSFEYSKSFIEGPDFELHHIYRALSLLSKHSDEIQSKVYQNSLDVIDRSKGILYYDCTNYFFEIEEERGNARFGKGKEHRPNPIIQMGLFMDGNGLPLSFSMFPGNESEQPSLKPLEQKILKDFGLSKFIVCTDAGLASIANRKFNDRGGRSFIVTQSLKKLKKHLQEWALAPEGWHLSGSPSTFNLAEIDEEDFMDATFYKERWINENGLEQRFIVTFSPKYKAYQQSVRESQIARAEKIVSIGKSATVRNPDSPMRFVEETAATADGEVAVKKKFSLNTDKILREESFDGFYGVCTTLEDDVHSIIAINKQRWQIEAAFRTMKSEFKARPVYLKRDDRIEAHFLTCFLSLLITGIIQKKLETTYSMESIIETLRNMNMHKLRGIGYLSSYERTDITDSLHDAFGFRTDTELVSEKTMKKIFKRTSKS